MFKMGCSMARKILPGSSSSGNGAGDGAGQQAACFSLGGQPGKSSSGRASENSNNSTAAAAAAAASQQGQDQPKRVANSSELNDFSKLEDDPRIPLNVRQIFKITKSWKAIARTMSKTGTAMFLNLFEQNQDLFYLFDRFQHLKGRELHESMELREHAATVMSTLDTSINSLSDYDNFVTYLHSIGELHRKVPGFKREYFWKIEQPFMKAVKQTLDERCNETIEEIYKIAIKLIIETIADGYGQDGQGGEGGGPVTSNERRDGAGNGGEARNGADGGGGGTQSGGNNNNMSAGDAGCKSGSAMASHEPSGAAGGQQRQRPHEVRQTTITTARAAATAAAAHDFTKSISKKKLNPFACPGPTHHSTGPAQDNNGRHGPIIISESQSHEREDEEKGYNKNNNKYSKARRLRCIVGRNQILVKTKRALQHMQSLIISAPAKLTTRHTNRNNTAYLEGHNQNIETTSHRPKDQDHGEQEDYLGELVVSTCKLLKTTSELIEERVQSQCERRATKSERHDDEESRGEDELAKLIKWRGLLTELTEGGGLGGTMANVTGDVQNSLAQRDTTTMMARLPAQTHPPAHNRQRFNIKSGSGSLVRVAVPIGANDSGNPLELQCGPGGGGPGESEPAAQNYNMASPLLATRPGSDLLAIAGCVTGGSGLGIRGSGEHTSTNDEPVTRARGASGLAIGLARSCCPRNATPRAEIIVRPVAESTAATATRTNIIRLASVGDDEAPARARELADVESAVLCERPPAADATNTQDNETDNSGADLIDFIKLLLMINNLILASTPLTDRTSSTLPQSNLPLTTIRPQVGV